MNLVNNLQQLLPTKSNQLLTRDASGNLVASGPVVAPNTTSVSVDAGQLFPPAGKSFAVGSGAFGVPGAVSEKKRKVIAMLGQSNEAGMMAWCPEGQPGSTKVSMRFRSLLNPSKFSDPIYPRKDGTTYKIGASVYQSPGLAGSYWPLLLDRLLASGIEVQNFFNCAAGSLSFCAHVVGRLEAWSANKSYSSYHASFGADNLGYKGAFILVGTKVFQCTAGGGYGIAFYHNPGAYVMTENSAERDSINDVYWAPPTSGTGKTGATAPNWAAAVNVGDTVTDNELTWTLVKTNESTYAAYPASNCIVDRNHVAFDPLGMLARIKVVLDADVTSADKWVFAQNGQSDLGTSDTFKTWYKFALTQIYNWANAQGYKVAFGATCADITLNPTSWNGKHPSQMISEAANEVVATVNNPTTCIKGGDLWTAFGVNVTMVPDTTGAADYGPGKHMSAVMAEKCANEWFRALRLSSAWVP